MFKLNNDIIKMAEIQMEYDKNHKKFYMEKNYKELLKIKANWVIFRSK